MARPLTDIRNIGPAVEAEFHRAGILDAETLEAMGADAAYRRLLESGTRPHFIGYYVLVLGLQGRPWNDASAAEKAQLRARFDALKAEVFGADAGKASAREAALNALGVIAKPRR